MDMARQILGGALLDKLNAISLYDICVVNNDQENIAYVTRPAAFSKFGNPFLEDALDLAKAFVSSLTYGMTPSAYIRGQIRYPGALIRALIEGRWIGPVKAIGEDYKVLELKGVVKVVPSGWGSVANFSDRHTAGTAHCGDMHFLQRRQNNLGCS